MVNAVKLVVLFLGLFLVSGCNQSGMDLASATSADSPATLSALLSSSSIESGDTTQDSDVSGDGGALQVARVHNPEPVSLLLFGAGLAGVALLRKKKKA